MPRIIFDVTTLFDNQDASNFFENYQKWKCFRKKIENVICEILSWMEVSEMGKHVMYYHRKLSRWKM